MALNYVMVMQQICAPFLKMGDDKLKKIEPTYMMTVKSEETPLCASRDAATSAKLEPPKEFGTISEFYFLLI